MTKKKASKPKVNPELEGFEMTINNFGEIRSSMNIDDLNTFLNKNVEDKKLTDREDLENIKKNPGKEKS